MILCSKEISINIANIEKDNSGRFLLLECTINDSEYILVNLYAPTIDKTRYQRAFGEYVYSKLEPHIGKSIILGGDINICLDDSLRSSTNCNKTYLDCLHKVMHNLDLIDIWRLKHPNAKRFTRREKTRYGFKQSRIDYFLISCHLEFLVVSTEILPSIKSDHSLLKLSLTANKDQTRGRGLWKFNGSLLNDNDYVDLVKDTINQSLEDSKNLANKELTWDFIKCCIRTKTISFSIKKKKQKTKHLEDLEKKLSELEELLSETPSDAIHNEYLETKKEIESIHDELARGHIIRSRCKLIEEYEKPTKYFLNLEKASQNVRHIRALQVGNKVIDDPNEILEEQKSFYSNLYTEKGDYSDLSNDKYCHNIGNNITKLSGISRDVCDQEITFEEVSAVVKTLPNNKSPGPDGFTAEFYKFFWHDIGNIVYRTYKDAFQQGRLIGTQNQGVIHLIPKKDKDLTVLSSWRPLSLLNTDYKILAKVLCNRLKTTLQEIINPDQIGYIEKRFSGENTRLISDIIEYCKLYKHPCIILLIDFEKAFDTVRWPFLKKLLKIYGFGDNFQKWISLLYTESESCVTNNGYLSPFFKLSRGIRQGCPISALLFLLVAEVAAVLIRETKEIHGIYVNKQEIRLCQLADDTTLFLSDSYSVKVALDIFETFHKYSGLKLNKSKTIVFVVQNNCLNLESGKYGIKWTTKPFKTLGTWFANDMTEMVSLNSNTKIDIIMSIINSWLPRKLSLKGKVTVVKSLILPHILQLASVVPISTSCLITLDQKLCNFVWNNNKHLVAKGTMLLPPVLGGLNMISAKYVCNTAHIMFIKRLCNTIKAKWKILTEFLMGYKVSEIFEKKRILTFHKYAKTTYYKSVLMSWFNIILTKPSSLDELLEENLFENPLFTTENKPFGTEYNNWKEAGISRVSDIFHNELKSVLNKIHLETKFRLSICDMKYNRLISCVSKNIKTLSKSPNVETFSKVSVPNKCMTNILKVKSSEVNNFYVLSNYKSPTSQEKWIEHYPFLHNINWPDIYSLPSKVTLDTYLITLQFKILHRIYNSNYNLFIWSIKDSSQCDFCSGTDNLEHFFFYCPISIVFWKQFTNWLCTSLYVSKKLSVLDVLFGLINVNNDEFYWLNFAILIGKYFISKCKRNKSELNFQYYINMLKNRISIDKLIYNKQDRGTIFDARFMYLYNMLI